ncbi:MAG: hypothetical protein HUJ91_05820 [Bacteroidales bacterium]|nr:hypothetical protein [Bacteroidales bacterium]
MRKNYTPPITEFTSIQLEGEFLTASKDPVNAAVSIDRQGSANGDVFSDDKIIANPFEITLD